VFQLRECVSGPQLVEIVYDQHNGSGRTGQFRHDRVDDHIAFNNRCSRLPSESAMASV
jgi:hypothetical protein